MTTFLAGLVLGAVSVIGVLFALDGSLQEPQADRSNVLELHPATIQQIAQRFGRLA